jgi:hypothetical protein
MGKGKSLRRSILLACTAVTLFLFAQTAWADNSVEDTSDYQWKHLSSIFDTPVILDTPDFDAGFAPILQDVVTTEEYDRLTGVHNRIGFGLFGGIGLLSGGAAGHGTILGQVMDADYGDIWSIMGTSGGVDLTIMVMPIYTINVGIGALYHAGDSTGGNTWDPLVAIPFYLGMRINLPLGVSHAVQPRSDRAVGTSKTVPEAGLVDALEVRERAAVSVGRHAKCAQIAAFGARSP